MYEKGTGNDKQRKDPGNRTLCPYRNFSQAIKRKSVLAFREISWKMQSKIVLNSESTFLENFSDVITCRTCTAHLSSVGC